MIERGECLIGTGRHSFFLGSARCHDPSSLFFSGVCVSQMVAQKSFEGPIRPQVGVSFRSSRGWRVLDTVIPRVIPMAQTGIWIVPQVIIQYPTRRVSFIHKPVTKSIIYELVTSRTTQNFKHKLGFPSFLVSIPIRECQ